jgi:hypothetical protein
VMKRCRSRGVCGALDDVSKVRMVSKELLDVSGGVVEGGGGRGAGEEVRSQGEGRARYFNSCQMISVCACWVDIGC